MKRTDDDQQFGAEFARRLKPFYDEAIANGQTEKEFARRIGVDRGGLQRYLRTYAMPSFRTIVLAYREFGIALPYASTDTWRLVSGKGKRRRRKTSELQMNLPLTIEAPQGEINVVIKKRSPQRIRLQLQALRLG
jgi:transcriptional regulator with XRE-family HTH domain